jgi:hypothetical protein
MDAIARVLEDAMGRVLTLLDHVAPLIRGGAR